MRTRCDDPGTRKHLPRNHEKDRENKSEETGLTLRLSQTACQVKNQWMAALLRTAEVLTRGVENM